MILPTVITAPGSYVTRCGDLVTVTTLGMHVTGTYKGLKDGFAHGHYNHGEIKETWLASGRIWTNRECNNDIVRAVGGIDYDMRIRLIREAKLKVDGLERLIEAGAGDHEALRDARAKLASFWNGQISG